MAAGRWTRVTRTTTCATSTCERVLERDAAAYLLAGQLPICPPCARRRVNLELPTDLPHLAPVVTEPPRSRQLLIADDGQPTGRRIDDNWGSVGRKAAGELRRLTQQQHAANAIDPKLKQLAGGDR